MILLCLRFQSQNVSMSQKNLVGKLRRASPGKKMRRGKSVGSLTLCSEQPSIIQLHVDLWNSLKDLRNIHGGPLPVIRWSYNPYTIQVGL